MYLLGATEALLNVQLSGVKICFHQGGPPTPLPLGILVDRCGHMHTPTLFAFSSTTGVALRT